MDPFNQAQIEKCAAQAKILLDTLSPKYQALFTLDDGHIVGAKPWEFTLHLGYRFSVDYGWDSFDKNFGWFLHDEDSDSDSGDDEPIPTHELLTTWMSDLIQPRLEEDGKRIMDIMSLHLTFALDTELTHDDLPASTLFAGVAGEWDYALIADQGPLKGRKLGVVLPNTEISSDCAVLEVYGWQDAL